MSAILAEDDIVFAEPIALDNNGNILLSDAMRSMLLNKVFNSDEDLFAVVRGKQVTVMNSAQFALLQFQLGMAGKAEEAGFKSEADAIAYAQKIRSEKQQ